ncbi:MAG: type II toxin-antitoxin system RelE/ParE family toxin [Rhodanobacter sp.]|nr:MAG: type II toxin-antitoxin system RelE/ParE family toxin [Rhodanobacter sp.]TAM39378.1 MAG: type II toxin-antitoxin system RelE/ParE family toxin [Rhodanobacter sp.]TAN26993.1 MAG: type II toxin-antitoxin system RelE/ParE family toxin [Rhodanobacter sp.]
MKIRFLRPAREELAEAIRYYNVQKAGLGDVFRNEAWATLQRIREFPLAWQALSGAIRRCQMQRFPYGVIYEPATAEIIVIAVAHLHREPVYWRGRSPRA